MYVCLGSLFYLRNAKSGLALLGDTAAVFKLFLIMISLVP